MTDHHRDAKTDVGSPARAMLRAFRTAPSGIFAIAALTLLLLVAILAPLLLHDQATTLHVIDSDLGPSSAHWLGTDRLGRDILARLLMATRLSVGLALLSAVAGIGLGLVIGALTAAAPGRIRSVMQRVIDVLQAFPTILVAIFVGAILGPGATGAVIGVALATGFHFSRIASTLAGSVGVRDYVLAARVVGVRGMRLQTRHVFPNIAEPLLLVTSVSIANGIVAVSALSFLGLGVQPPQFDWGRMLNEGIQEFYVQPWAAIGPGICIALAALTFGLAGEALARAMNPLLWTATRGTRRKRRGRKLAAAAAAAPATPAPTPTGAVALRSNGDGNVLDVHDLGVSFPGADGPVPVVAGVSFSVSKGETVGIVGESGSGKTMTAMAITQLLPHGAGVDGAIELRGLDVERMPGRQLDDYLAREVAVIFQDPMSSLNPALRIGTQVTEATIAHGLGTKQQARELALTRLGEVNIPSPRHVLQQHPHELSGGMRQRVMIAMGLTNEPELLIADEPTTALDVTIQAQVMEVLTEINTTHGTSIILISHDLGLVAQNCTRILVMYAGRIVEDGSTQELVEEPLHPYTRALLQSIPQISQRHDDALQGIPGSSPDMTDLPSGCSFHPRCPLATDHCRTERPKLVEHSGGRRVACWAAEGES